MPRRKLIPIQPILLIIALIRVRIVVVIRRAAHHLKISPTITLPLFIFERELIHESLVVFLSGARLVLATFFKHSGEGRSALITSEEISLLHFVLEKSSIFLVYHHLRKVRVKQVMLFCSLVCMHHAFRWTLF